MLLLIALPVGLTTLSVPPVPRLTAVAPMDPANAAVPICSVPPLIVVAPV